MRRTLCSRRSDGRATDLDWFPSSATVRRMAVHDPLSGQEGSLTGPSPECGCLSPFRALRHPNYRLFFFGQMVSLVGSWMQTTALMWLAFHLTHTSRWPALVAAAQMAPA